jgi:glutamine synthetase
VEYEVFVFHADADMLAAGRGNEMRPLSRTWNAYSLLRLTELRELFVEFMRRMAAIGAPLDSTHSEIGHGAVEFAIGYAPAMDAADHAMRAKTYLKELCNEPAHAVGTLGAGERLLGRG